MTGIEGLKAELDLGFAVFGGIKAAGADGKIGLEDLGLLLTLVGPVQKAFEARLSLGAELSDLTVEEGAELAAYAAAKLGGVADAALVNKVTMVMKAMVANYAAIKAFV
jgi:hypothetical protein